MKKLSTVDRHALHVLEKHGEMILGEAGVYFHNIRSAVKRSQIEKLAKLGLARVEAVGASTFASFVRNP